MRAARGSGRLSLLDRCYAKNRSLGKARFLGTLYAPLRELNKQSTQNGVPRLYRPDTGADQGREGLSRCLAPTSS